MKVSLLKFKIRNPRKISPEQLDKLKDSITKFPKMMELRPIIYDPETMQVLGGNQRLAAIKALNMKEIPDTWAKPATELDDTEKQRFIVQDNHQSGEWDFDILEMDFDAEMLGDIGIELPEMSVKIDIEDEDEYIEEPDIETSINTGDMYSFMIDGKEIHRLLCGDSTKIEDVIKVVGQNKIVACITDPPYSVDYENIKRTMDTPTRKEAGSIYEDGSAKDILKFIQCLPCDIFIMSYPLAKHFHLLSDATSEWDMLYELVWVKNTFAFNMYKNYQQKHEMLFVFRKKSMEKLQCLCLIIKAQCSK
jgi:hypothetical protein